MLRPGDWIANRGRCYTGQAAISLSIRPAPSRRLRLPFSCLTISSRLPFWSNHSRMGSSALFFRRSPANLTVCRLKSVSNGRYLYRCSIVSVTWHPRPGMRLHVCYSHAVEAWSRWLFEGQAPNTATTSGRTAGKWSRRQYKWPEGPGARTRKYGKSNIIIDTNEPYL